MEIIIELRHYIHAFQSQCCQQDEKEDDTKAASNLCLASVIVILGVGPLTNLAYRFFLRLLYHLKTFCHRNTAESKVVLCSGNPPLVHQNARQRRVVTELKCPGPFERERYSLL
jgi:hypothetical protein